MREDATYGVKQIEVGRGDVLAFYTDGFTEAFNERQELFGEERMKQVLTRHAAEPPGRLLEAIQHDLEAFVGAAPQSDDRTIVIAKRV
jgi:sigma-B regulation protein RsbU (phosphoserine phosphatase)